MRPAKGLKVRVQRRGRRNREERRIRDGGRGGLEKTLKFISGVSGGSAEEDHQ